MLNVAPIVDCVMEWVGLFLLEKDKEYPEKMGVMQYMTPSGPIVIMMYKDWEELQALSDLPVHIEQSSLH